MPEMDAFDKAIDELAEGFEELRSAKAMEPIAGAEATRRAAKARRKVGDALWLLIGRKIYESKGR